MNTHHNLTHNLAGYIQMAIYEQKHASSGVDEPTASLRETETPGRFSII